MKRFARAASAGSPTRIPRRNRRGLIEARPGGPDGRKPNREFPGEIAGASLKRPQGLAAGLDQA